jgi:hypothetical protein
VVGPKPEKSGIRATGNHNSKIAGEVEEMAA